MLAVLIVVMTALAAVASWYLGSMQNNSQKSIGPGFIAYGLMGIGVVYLLSRRDVGLPSILLACAWAAPAVFLVARLALR